MEQRPESGEAAAETARDAASDTAGEPAAGPGWRSQLRWRTISWVVVSAAILGTIAIQWYLAARSSNNGVGSLIDSGPNDADAPQPIGGSVPQQPLPVLGSDTTLTLTELRGSPVVINVWASTCAPCKAEMPAFERVFQDVQKAKPVPGTPGAVRFVGIDSGESPKDGLLMVERTGVTYTNVSDPQQAATRQLGVAALPGTIFIDRSGTIRYAHAGAMSEDDLRAALRDHLGVDT